VSKAGGLGSFGGINAYHGPVCIHEQAALIRRTTDRPFAIGFITAFLPDFDGHFQAALDAKAPVIAFSFGEPAPWIARAKRAGARVMCQVQSRGHAAAAAAAGADYLVAQGNEAGGHTGAIGLLPLLTSVIDAFPDLPVLASGGIANGRSLAALLTAGADGVWMGTAFLATTECVDIADEYKQLIVASDGEDTIFTQCYDLASGDPWPEGIGERVRRNAFTQRWHGRDDDVIANRKRISAELRAHSKTFNPDETAVLFGESAGAVKLVRTTAEVIHDITRDAERLLRERTKLVD
jgi:nitronate monooxygenase